MSTVAQRCAEEAAALDREALALVDTQLRKLFSERERMAEHARDEQITDTALRRTTVSPGPRGIEVAPALVVRYGSDFRGWVQMLLETLKR